MTHRNGLVLSFSGLNAKPQGALSLVAALKHNARQLHAETKDGKYDPTLSHFNTSLGEGPADPAAALAMVKQLHGKAGYSPPRKDAVIAVEGVFSLPPDSAVSDQDAFFTACAQWLTHRLAGTLLSADVHRDQGPTHCHVIVALPMRPGCESGSSMLGGASELNKHAEDFQRRVGDSFGVHVNPSDSRAVKLHLANEVKRFLHRVADPVLDSSLWTWVERCLSKDPRGAMLAVGMIAAPDQGSPLSRLALTEGKGPRTRVAQERSDARLALAWNREESSAERVSSADAPDTYSRCSSPPSAEPTPTLCRCSPAAPEPSPAGPVTTSTPPASLAQPFLDPPEPPTEAAEFTRERDTAQSADAWDSERGEFIQPSRSPNFADEARALRDQLRGQAAPASPNSMKAAAWALVASMLQALPEQAT